MAWLEPLGPTILTLIGGAIGWILKSRVDAKRRAEEILRVERAAAYAEILSPFFRIFTDLSSENQKEALKQIQSFDYRKQAFQLALIGDDPVVQAWNGMWATLYEAEKDQSNRMEIIFRFGEVLLAIRRSLGNANTRLTRKDMLRWMIKDIDDLGE